ncbi:hypothetical protein D3C72_2218250 [compost metagenome]
MAQRMHAAVLRRHDRFPLIVFLVGRDRHPCPQLRRNEAAVDDIRQAFDLPNTIRENEMGRPCLLSDFRSIIALTNKRAAVGEPPFFESINNGWAGRH